ncbi:hypothetical protein [Haloarchaeobius sp. DFWS5]|uniref:hypothetical protein n=1 Tax=Haloarchaeobius sp. DFWS5 TaxID=3446114 RepID=UPI003EB6D80F
MTTGAHVTADFRCSACAGRVGVTSRTCIHCDADLRESTPATSADENSGGDDDLESALASTTDSPIRNAAGRGLQLLALLVALFPLTQTLPLLVDGILAGDAVLALFAVLDVLTFELVAAFVWVPLLLVGAWVRR